MLLTGAMLRPAIVLKAGNHTYLTDGRHRGLPLAMYGRFLERLRIHLPREQPWLPSTGTRCYDVCLMVI